jgi:ribose transport system substrate-binding protein
MTRISRSARIDGAPVRSKAALSTAVATPLVVCLLLAACGGSGTAGQADASLAGSGRPAAAAVAVAADGNSGTASDENAENAAVPPAVAATGGEVLLPKPADPGIAAVYGPLCSASDYNGGVPKIDFKKDKIAFAQSESDASAYRAASTKSMKDEAKKRGWNLLYANAGGDPVLQNRQIKQMIDRGAKAVIFSPASSQGMTDALGYAKQHKVPVIVVDRSLTGVKPCADFVAQLGSDFIGQGRRAADAMIKATGGHAKLAILFGVAGVNVTDDRTKGFIDRIIEKAPGIEIVDQRTAEFNRDKGEEVFASVIKDHPEVNALYAENDEMGLGALRVLKKLGRNGRDQMKIVSIDGTKDAVHAILAGDFDAVIECNPRFGPSSFDALEAFFGAGAPAVTFTTDGDYDTRTAKARQSHAF